MKNQRHCLPSLPCIPYFLLSLSMPYLLFFLIFLMKNFKKPFPSGKAYLCFLHLILQIEFSDFIEICVCWMPKLFQALLLLDYAVRIISQHNTSTLSKLGETLEFDDDDTVYILLQSIHKCSEYLLMCHTLCWKRKDEQTPSKYLWSCNK